MAVQGIVAKIRVQEGKEAEFEKVFGDLREQVRANEEGNLLYDFFRVKNETSTYIVMEQYASEEALAAHGQSEHFKAAGPKLGAVLAGAPELTFLDQAG